jgi:ATP-dependent RNA helicase DDX3X
LASFSTYYTILLSLIICPELLTSFILSDFMLTGDSEPLGMSVVSEPRNTFGMSDMGVALPDTASNGGDVGSTKAQAEKERAEAVAKANAHNWAPTTKYDYSVYNANSREAKDALDGEPAWLQNAAKYEWSDEFGDVGPKNPLLEAQLYHGEFLMRSGAMMDALEYTVETKGTNTVRPIRKVRCIYLV